MLLTIPTFLRYKSGPVAINPAYLSNLIWGHTSNSYRGCWSRKAEWFSSLVISCKSSRPWSGHVTRLVGCWVTCTKPWAPSPILHKLNVVVHTYNPSIQEMKTGRSEIQGYQRLHGEFEVILGYMRSYLKNQNQTNHNLMLKKSFSKSNICSSVNIDALSLLFLSFSWRFNLGVHGAYND